MKIVEASQAETEQPVVEVASAQATSAVLGIMAAVFMVSAEARVIAPVLPALATEYHKVMRSQ